MKIAYLTSEAGLGGGETSLLNLMAGMHSQGLPVELVCPSGSLSEAAKNQKLTVTNLALPNARLRGGFLPSCSPGAIARMLRIIVTHRIGILHTESFLALIYGGSAARLAGIPCLATCHGYWPIPGDSTSPLLSRLLFAACCRRIYPVSRVVERQFGPAISRFPHVIVRTVPLDMNPTFYAALPERNEARRLLDLPLDASMIIQFARFQDIKGQADLLTAFELLLAANTRHPTPRPGSGFLLAFVGGLPEPAGPEDRAYYARIRFDASRLSHRVPTALLCSPSPVRFLGHRSDVPLLMRAADVVVIPSVRETFGMVAIEAAAIGTPVVATNVGGIPEILTHRESALLVPPGDPQALAAAIRETIDNNDATRARAERASLTVRRKYAPGTRARAMISEYRELVPGSWFPVPGAKNQEPRTKNPSEVPCAS